ncbi:Fusaric acid resistance protein-like [Agrococcus baldri]|uniref:Fusaric acid resistance protein-like n=1 Tax=Agrococcus baldri TaxID=153730 RepID=A0AA94HNH2_9MICO|nr:FUSC family protein [Agrococcus baldri]SFS15209.1 Fusaric acid resistance protein-like [Agrococcus baldri]
MQLRRVARSAIGVLLAGTIAVTFVAELLVGRDYGIAMIAITPLALLAVPLASPTAVEVLVVDRLVESLVGALVGILVGFATRRWAPREA